LGAIYDHLILLGNPTIAHTTPKTTTSSGNPRKKGVHSCGRGHSGWFIWSQGDSYFYGFHCRT